MSHTPGPWHVEDGFVWRGNETIADPHCSKLLDSEEMEDNAILIAAAPDLLAALERLTHPMANDDDLQFALETIAKAKGQS